jgi:hypothetical protein
MGSNDQGRLLLGAVGLLFVLHIGKTVVADSDEPLVSQRGMQADAVLTEWRDQAWRGSRTAIDAIANIETPEATRELLALLDTTDEQQLLHVLELLTRRLPVPTYPDRECPFTDLRTQQRRDLSARAWKADDALEVRLFAKELLQHQNVRLAGYGAIMITCVGEVEDSPAVIAAMDRILEQTRDPKAKPGYMPATFDPFLMASQGQTYRGDPICTEPQTAGEIVVYIAKLSTHPDWRPEGWEAKCLSWRTHPVPYIRHIASRRGKR